VSLADARKQRDIAKELLAKNIAPKEHKDELARQQKEKLSNTFEQVAANWYQVKKTEVSPDHAKDLWRSLEIHIFPALGKHPITLMVDVSQQNQATAIDYNGCSFFLF